MAVWEVLSLDGLTLTGDPTGTLILEAFSNPPPKARLEWLQAADSEGSALMRAPQHDNREVTFRLRVAQQASMNLALDQAGSVVDKLRKAARTEGGIAMTWTPAGSTRTATFDVLAGEITDLPITWNGDDHGWFASRPVMNVTLTCEPYMRGAEVLTSTASSGATPFATLEVANVPGDIAALGRLIVTDTATQSRRHIEWGLEGRSYNSALSLIVESDAMTTTGFGGAGATRTGAYDPGAAGNSVARAQAYSWPVTIASTGNLSHVGSFRVKARVYSEASNIEARLRWQVGDGPFFANPWVSSPVINSFGEIDLGAITIPAAATGTQRWTGQVDIIVAPGTQIPATNNFDVDFLQLVPTDEGYGRASAPLALTPATGVARDEFTGTTAGVALNARVAPLGGTWATSGAATDFIFADPGGGVETVSRATVSDTGTGRHAVLGATNYTNIEARIAVLYGTTPGVSIHSSVMVRYVDASNYLQTRWVVSPGAGSAATQQLFLSQMIAGVETVIDSGTLFADANTWYNIKVIAYTSGRVIGLVNTGDSLPPLLVLEGTSSAVATGGTLATGKIGFKDAASTAVAATRYYDEFFAGTPAPEPIALYSGRTMEFRHDTVIRQDSAGTYYGRPPSYRGSRFLLPPGTSRVMVKARRNDVETSEDANVTDATQVQVAYQPRYLAVPR